MKCVTVLGARPQFIKASVVSAAFRAHSKIQEYVVHTGQHHDENMSDVFFRELCMKPPDIHLGTHGGSHAQMTGRMLGRIEDVLLSEKPNIVLVYGDTNSTLAGALAAAKLALPVAHVEAGLRSFNRLMPEEVNRVVADHVSSWLFAPTQAAVSHLHREGIDPATVFQVGDVMYDAAKQHAGLGEERGVRIMDSLGLRERPYVLATVHRPENTDVRHRLSVIVQAFVEVAAHLPVVWPLHPRTRKSLDQHGFLTDLADHLILLEPQGYLDMAALERSASLIATDSGGLQKEAFFHRVPCVTLRDETEWLELVDLGWNRLVSPQSVECVREALLDAIGTVGVDAEPYGDGRAAARIAAHLEAAIPHL